MICDSMNQKFWVPSDKADKLIKLIQGIVRKGETYYRQLEKVVGKCASVSVAIPMATLFTRVQRSVLKSYQRPHRRNEGGHRIEVTHELRKELLVWPLLLTKLNGASWYRATQFTLKLKGILTHLPGGMVLR